MKAIREALGLSQVQFGVLIGGAETPVSHTTVSRREVSASARLDWDEIVRLDEAMSKKGLRFCDFHGAAQQTETP